MDNELLLFDRIEAIKLTNQKYDLEHNAYLSFSGGKDSTVLHYLLDMALPNNKIPRIYSNTGIEYSKIKDFVEELSKNDSRIIILKPSLPIKQTLEKYGYPFKSKLHSYLVEKYQRLGRTEGVINYLGEGNKSTFTKCPIKLKYQFTSQFKIKISDMCCKKMKEEPMINWSKLNNKEIAITGIMHDEGGRRTKSNCLGLLKGKLKFFNPLIKINKEWEDWFIKEYHLKICELYNNPYNFERTGCKGCPFALNLQNELDTLEKYFPNERKQCEIIWKPVYEEYRRLNYRLKNIKQLNLLEDI